MYRALPVANKACAERERSRQDKAHRDRIQNMRPSVDTTVPHTAQMEHLRVNMKREQMLEDRYRTIDNENRILLNKMSDIMKHSTHAPRPRSGPVSLNRDGRKMELMRITSENQNLLSRIQRAQPVYNHVAWEDDNRRNYAHLKNIVEYPLVLRKTGARSSSMTPVAASTAPPGKAWPAGQSTSPDPQAGKSIDDMRYVFKEGRKMGPHYYMIEMATDGRTLAVTAYEGDQQTTLELVINERTHRKLYRELNGDYSRVAEKLKIVGDQLTLDPKDGPLDGTPQQPELVVTA
mmetsp:Transcript_43226/g.92468  ORF Transcript_43226/g.92468 Transcript_43226/m.92468 type:complete len:291 (-) Transcript_43226:252-1124(-)|eukprot:CAMPEP_0206476890 /NCGR_PEP_ID=MMETSP0324_2-20121206/35010_1 /ASSEMBLY_ACC=CAM_ASM_000836 /TAXON_ID=2866 /ORGANISM="Crypthecodinium cohnii, Strain Seligo" /LENGTH=290 /DNA_ID=CAMNT_0053952657 /DNA_START=104 /DNA_END=976 /DNA_ORIENTATION=+